MNQRDSDSTRSTSPKSADSWRRIVLENALDAVVGIDDSDSIIDWNHQAEVTFGWTKEQALGKNMADLIIPVEYRERHRRGLQHFLETGEGPILNRRIEVSALHRTGHTFPVELTVMPLRVDGSQLSYSFVRDLTERRKHEAVVREAQQALSASESLFRTLFEQAPFSTQLLSANGRTLQVNDAWRRLWNVPSEVVEGYVLKEYKHPCRPTAKGKRGLTFH